MKRAGERPTFLPVGEEWKIVQRAIAGDCEPLAILFAHERPRLYRTAFAVLRNKEDAEDALQNGLLSAFVNLPSFQGRSKFSTWLMRVVLNAALIDRRKLRVRRQISLDESFAINSQPWSARIVDPNPGPEQLCAMAELIDVLDAKLSQLSPILRSAFHLRDIEHLSTREAANIASVKMSAMKSRTMRARNQVTNLLYDWDVNLPVARF